jgi:hypothetical protein
MGRVQWALSLSASLTQWRCTGNGPVPALQPTRESRDNEVDALPSNTDEYKPPLVHTFWWDGLFARAGSH